MATRRILRLLLTAGLLAGALALPQTAAQAWSGRCGDFVTAEAGDTLESIASDCGASLAAIRAANPGVVSALAAGQVIYVPGGTQPHSDTPLPGGTNSYSVQPGETLSGIAFLFGLPLSTLLALNPQITDPSVIYPGQVIMLPGTLPPTPGVTPGAQPSSPYANLKVTSGHGLRVRTGPGTNYPEILSIYVSAVKNTPWQYRKASVTTDATGFVWVEIVLNPLSGQTTGWILTRDSLGTYFTRPNIGARLDRSAR